MKYPRDFTEKVVAATNIVEIISQHTVLKNKGKDLWGLCPFPDHKEKTASFSVSSERQLYHCFGCKKGGNVFTFLEHYQGLNFAESLELLANRANIPLPVKNEAQFFQSQESEKKRKSLIEITSTAAYFFQESLKRHDLQHPIHKYIINRGLKPETLKEFKVGYAPQTWDGLVQFLKKKNLSLALAEEAGLILSKDKDSNGFYDRFRDRLIFVITNPMGEPIAFGGRVLDDSLPKYINSPETPLFHKGKSLFGLYQTGRYIRSENYSLIVEGYMDLIALYQAGIKNVVAPLGTALTLDQCRLLTRFTKNVVVLFDGDDAGQGAMERSLPLLFEAGCYPRGLTLPDKLDPDEYLHTYGAEQLKKLIDKSPDLFSLLAQKWLLNYTGSATDKMRIMHILAPILNSIIETPLKSLYLKEMSLKMGVDERWLRDAVLDPNKAKLQSQITSKSAYSTSHENQVLNKKNVAYANVVPTINSNNNNHQIQTGEILPNVKNDIEDTKISLNGAPKVELLLLALVLNSDPKTWDRILHTNHKVYFTHEGVKKVLQLAEDFAGQTQTRSATLITLVTNEITQIEPLTAAMNQLPVDDSEAEAKLLNDCLRKLQMNYLDLQLKAVAQELKHTPSTEKLEQLSSLKRERMKILEKA